MCCMGIRLAGFVRSVSGEDSEMTTDLKIERKFNHIFVLILPQHSNADLKSSVPFKIHLCLDCNMESCEYAVAVMKNSRQLHSTKKTFEEIVNPTRCLEEMNKQCGTDCKAIFLLHIFPTGVSERPYIGEKRFSPGNFHSPLWEHSKQPQRNRKTQRQDNAEYTECWWRKPLSSAQT